jgi:hypothetical protein
VTGLTPTNPPSLLSPDKKNLPHVAIIYVHGMGSQRRNEETSRLIDALDYYLVSRSLDKNGGNWRNPKEGLQYQKIEMQELTSKTYIRPLSATYHKRGCENCYPEDLLKLTFIEGYWAPEMAGVVGTGQVLTWLVRQSLIPFFNLLTGWDKLARIRQNALIGFLHEKFHKLALKPSRSWTYKSINEKIERPKFETLMKLYLYFNRVDLTRHSPSFLRRFNEFLRTETLNAPGLLDPEARVNPEHVRTELDTEPHRFLNWLPAYIKRIIKFSWSVVAKQNHPDGSFESPTQERKGLLQLLNRWSWEFVLNQWTVQAFIFAIWCTTAALLLTILWLTQNVLLALMKLQTHDFKMPIRLGTEIDPTITYILFCLMLAVLIYFRHKIPEFITNFLGDVMQWTTYNESERFNRNRTRVLERFKEILSSALNDKGDQRQTSAYTDEFEAEPFQTRIKSPKFDRVVIIAHSLGSAIVLDSLVSIFNEIESKVGPFKDRKNDLNRITHLFTMGSPIDKIFYFFESRPSAFAHHNYFIEQNRGDLKKWRKDGYYKNLNWINYYDRSDLIAGPIYSLNTISDKVVPDGMPPEHIWNVPINHFTTGSLTKSHGTYFENTDVIASIWQAISEDHSQQKQAQSSEELKNRFVAEHYPKIAQRMPWWIGAQVLVCMLFLPIVMILGLFRQVSAEVFFTSSLVMLGWFLWTCWLTDWCVPDEFRLFSRRKDHSALFKGTFPHRK